MDGGVSGRRRAAGGSCDARACPSTSLACPAIGVRQLPSRAARKARLQQLKDQALEAARYHDEQASSKRLRVEERQRAAAAAPPVGGDVQVRETQTRGGGATATFDYATGQFALKPIAEKPEAIFKLITDCAPLPPRRSAALQACGHTRACPGDAVLTRSGVPWSQATSTT